MSITNRLNEAFKYRKEGSELVIMYGLFFSVGYLYGYTNFKFGFGLVLMLFIIWLIIRIIVGKKEVENK